MSMLICVGAAAATGTIAGAHAMAAALHQRLWEISSASLQEGAFAGLVMGLIAGLFIGAVTHHRLRATGKPNRLWRGALDSAVLGGAAIWILTFCMVAGSAAC
jgi:hypothetical protein